MTDLLKKTAKLEPNLAQQVGAKAQRKLKSLTGIVTYFYDFHIAPRSAADIEE